MQRSRPRGLRWYALSTITELSGRTLAELRAFVQTLHDTDMDWHSLSVELRRLGAQLLEGTGKMFRMEVHIEHAPMPTSTACLNVLRVVREALTNVMKHGNGGEVTATLNIDSAGMLLEIIKVPGVNAHRGLVNTCGNALGTWAGHPPWK